MGEAFHGACRLFNKPRKKKIPDFHRHRREEKTLSRAIAAGMGEGKHEQLPCFVPVENRVWGKGKIDEGL